MSVLVFFCFTASFENQRVMWTDAKSLQKSVSNVWLICYKTVLLHPLSREKRRWVLKYWNEVKVTNLHWKKLFFWKFLLKSFGSSEKVLTFASAFEKKAIKKSSLKDLDINKQVVQDYSIKNYELIIKNWELQKPSIT